MSGVNTSPFSPSVLAQAQKGAPKHILVIDDEAPILDLLSEYLSAQGYRISTASTGAEASAVVEEEAPALIISDLQLADTDGLRLVEQFKVFLPTTPVILLTGVLFDAHVIEANLKGKISAYVSKTAPLQVLLGEIRRLIGS